MIFLTWFRRLRWPPGSMLHSTIDRASLDGIETKSEDYQRDVSRRTVQSRVTALNRGKSRSIATRSCRGKRSCFDLESVAG
jgi:hypothetical protein